MSEFTQSDPLSIDIVIEDPAWQSLEFDCISYVKEVVIKTLAGAGYQDKICQIGMCLALADDDLLRELNSTHRGKDEATNVLSFQYYDFSTTDDPLLNEPSLHLFPTSSGLFIGDIAISYGRISAESIVGDKTFKQHLAHIVIHGVLHLLGYDHIKGEDAEKMEKLEIETLRSIGWPNPYRFETDLD